MDKIIDENGNEWLLDPDDNYLRLKGSKENIRKTLSKLNTKPNRSEEV